MSDFDPRYLQAKESVDNRSRSDNVRDLFLQSLPAAPTILDIGCGTGVFARRLIEWQQTSGTYLGVDRSSAAIEYARDNWTGKHLSEHLNDSGETSSSADDLQVRFQAADIREELPIEYPDAIVAQQFMDLVSIDAVLDSLLDRLPPGGVAYFPLTFDGETIFLPTHETDEEVIGEYHQSMSDRTTQGPATGRALATALGNRDGSLIGFDASDAVVHPVDGAYKEDERYFLECLLSFVESSTTGDAAEKWISTRRQQLQAGKLSYVAHRYDLLYRTPKK